MKAEKILSFIENAISQEDKTSRDTFNTFCKRAAESGATIDKPAASLDPKIYALAVIYTEAKAEYNNEIAKTAGRLNAKKAAESMLKIMRESRPQAGAVKTPDGYYIFASPYHGIRIADNFNITAWQGVPPDFNRIFDQYAENRGERLTAPTVAELKNIIRQTKEENKGKSKYAKAAPLYDFGENAPAVNAEFLLQIMQAIGEDIVITAAAKNPMVSGLYIYTNIGDAILMPSKKQNNRPGAGGRKPAKTRLNAI